jgi:hypothetical protein
MCQPNRVTALIGAGASLELGVPSTDDATKKVLEGEPGEEEHQSNKESLSILTQTFAILRQSAPKAVPNFEHLLHALEIMVTMRRAWRSTGGSDLRNIFGLLTNGPKSELLPLFQAGLAEQAINQLFCRLHAVFSDHRPADTRPAEWSNYEQFWRSLARSYGLDIATTNYDDLLEQAIPTLNQGFVPITDEETSRFTPNELRQAWDRLVHLHGSIHFGYRDFRVNSNRFAFRDSWNDVYWHKNPAHAQRSWGGRSNPHAQSGEELVIGPLLTGLQKPDKVLAAEPYATYYRTLGNWLETNSRLLVVGYGFGDAHINSLLSRITSWHGDSRKVVLITHLPENEWVHLRHDVDHRVEEKMAISGWSEDDEIWRDQMFHYSDTWTSKNGLCRVYLGGLLPTSGQYLQDILSFLS